MEWNVTYVVYRIAPDNAVTEVFHTSELTKAKYWMSYIAVPGDVLVKTPFHPKHSKATKIAEYWSHKDRSGKAITDLQKWAEYLATSRLEPLWPEEQLSQPATA